MTLQMLEYFIALAQKGSFTDAANACFVSQPALSRAIATLEKELECVLVDRENRKVVRLTEAGETLLIEAKRIAGQMDTLKERVQRADRQSQREVSMGYIAYGLLRAFRWSSADVLRRMKEERIQLMPVYAAAPEIKERVLSGELDCALLPESCTIDMMGCKSHIVCVSAQRIMIPKEHPCFGRQSIRLEELRGSRFVFFDPRDLPATLSLHLSMCREAGFTPKIAGYGRKIGDVTDLLHQHGAVGIASEAFEYARTDDLAFVPVEGKDYTYNLMLVMKERAVNPAMERVFGWLTEMTV